MTSQVDDYQPLFSKKQVVDSISQQPLFSKKRVIYNILCEVCYELSNGKHHGIYTCGACEHFFRRSCKLNCKYVCKAEIKGSCTVTNKIDRSKCPSCRLQRCLDLGMYKYTPMTSNKYESNKHSKTFSHKTTQTSRATKEQCTQIACAKKEQFTQTPTLQGLPPISPPSPNQLPGTFDFEYNPYPSNIKLNPILCLIHHSGQECACGWY